MSTVLVFGTFDLLHEGHERFLAEAGRRGDRLVALVARDDFVRLFKGKPARHSEEERRSRLVERGLVDAAQLSDPVPGTYEAVLRLAPDLICLGYDQERLRDSLETWMAAGGREIPIQVLPHFPVPGRGN